MALPTVTKTWTISANNTRYYMNDMWDKRTVIVQIKDWFKSVGWTVRSNCYWNGSSYVVNQNSTDGWTTASALQYNYPGSNHSWIVLRAPSAFGANFDLQLSCASWPSNYGSYLLIKTAQGGYNLNGSATADPTAISLEHVHVCESQGQTGRGNHCGLGRYDWGYTHRWHAMSSSDQKNFRVFLCENGWCQGIWLLERLDTVEAPGVWTEPIYTCFATPGHYNHNSSSALDPFVAGSTQYSQCWQAGWMKTSLGRGHISGTGVSFYLSSEYLSSDPVGVHMGVYNEISQKWPMYPLGIVCDSVGKRGRQGMLTDAWMGQQGIWHQNESNNNWGVIDGETFPEDGSRKFVQFGNLIFPWTGSQSSPTSVPCYTM